jgi:membrane-associated phospholipid phosphatase
VTDSEARHNDQSSAKSPKRERKVFNGIVIGVKMTSIFEVQTERLKSWLGANWRWIAIVCVVLCLTMAVAFAADQTVRSWITEHRSQSWKDRATWVSKYSNWPLLMVETALLAALSVCTNRKLATRWILIMMVSASLAGAVALPLRAVAGRTRPSCKLAPDGWYGIRSDSRWIIGNSEYQSFPSGHTAVMAGLCLPLLWVSAPAAAIGGVLIAIVALARLTLDLHHLSDIVASIWIGFFIATFVVWRWRCMDTRDSS